MKWRSQKGKIVHILLTGGGTGGHIIPLLAVADELKKQDSSVTLSYIGEQGSKFAHLTESSELFVNRELIFAGKFRRYHDDSLIDKILDFKTNLLNLRDAFLAVIGTVQAILILRKLRPNIIFVKGGYVGVPVGLAAALLGIPFITHDSDTIPGLANKIISRWALLHATGMPVELYPYPSTKTAYVGIPVSSDFKPADSKRTLAAKKKLSLPKDSQLLVITGGSQGSKRINESVRGIVEELLAKYPTLHIVHHVGQGNESIYSGFAEPRLHVEPFIEAFSEVVTAADVVVTRGGANSLTELGIVGKPTVVIPSPFLSGGHQLKNAEYLEKRGAILNLEEEKVQSNPSVLIDAISKLLTDKKAAEALSKTLRSITKHGAANEIAKLLIESSK